MTSCTIIGRVLYVAFMVVVTVAIINWFKAVRAYVKAINTRKPGVSLLRGMDAFNLHFRRDLYNDDRDRWLEAYWRGCVRFVLICVVAWASAGLFVYVCGKPLRW